MMLQAHSNINLVAGFGYLQAFLGIFYQIGLQGGLDYHGLLGAQAFGEENYKSVNLFFRQGLLYGYSVFTAVTVIPVFFLINLIFFVIGTRDELKHSTRSLIVWMIPAMALRIFADHFKTFLMNQGLMKISGFILSLALIIFAISGYIFIVWLDMGAAGVGISMAIY